NLVKRIIYRYGIYCKFNLFLSVVGSQGIVTCCKNTFFVVNIFNGWLFCESEVRKNILYTCITSFNTFLKILKRCCAVIFQYNLNGRYYTMFTIYGVFKKSYHLISTFMC